MNRQPSAPRLRFAPSPTGHLHIGGARTALYNFLLAKKLGGTFILRIEDTDRERSTQEYIDSILEAMRWLGLSYDEGPYFQTQNSALYEEHLQKLLESGRAYRCFCSSETLEAKRAAALARGDKPKYDGQCRDLDPKISAEKPEPSCIRFRGAEGGATVVRDLIKGEVVFDNAELDDLVIARSDGTPTYNFVVVVDDVSMGITQVIRGDDHLNNTPRQIQLYEAFGYPCPQFAHIPMILGADKKRLSKRHGATSVLAYRDMGYLPEALLNYLVRLGWAHGDQEVFSISELAELFSIEAVGKSAAVFNPEKLDWLNAHWLRHSPIERIAELAQPFFAELGIELKSDEFHHAALKSCLEKVKNLRELAQMGAFYFRKDIQVPSELRDKFLSPEKLKLLKALQERLLLWKSFEAPALEIALKEFCTELGMKLGDVASPLRVSLSGSSVSPGIYDMLSVLGKDEVLRRLDLCLG